MVLSELSIRRPVFAWMLMIGLIGFGLVSYNRLGVSQLPDVDFPVITISLKLEGAAPEVMEQNVVDVIEDKLMSIEGIKKMSSSSKNGSATISVEFDLARNIDVALQDVQSKVSQSLKMLPPQLDPPAITKTNPDDFPIISLAIEAPHMSRKDLMVYLRDELKNYFTTIDGVGDITLGGYLDPNMRIWIKDEALKKYGLAANDVIGTLKNQQVDPPTGQVDLDYKQYNLRFYGEAATPQEFANLKIDRIGGQTVEWDPPKLGDVARIEEGLADITTVSRAMGTSGVSLGIIKQRGTNAVAVAQAVKAKVKEVQKVLREGVTLAVNFDSTKFIQEAVDDLVFTIFLSALLTGLVCWAFLGSWSSTFNVLMAIPVSIVGSFTIFYFLGFTLNTFTLLALNLAIGIVVDDAIMVLENIVRHKEMGKTRVVAALDGSREITFAAIAASISVVAIFLPVAFMHGLIGRFFFQFGVGMTVAVMISLLEAVTLTPMRAAIFDSHRDSNSKIGAPIIRWVDETLRGLTQMYSRTLEIALQKPSRILFLTFIIAVVGSISYLNLRQEFLPPEDQSRFAIRGTAPIGSSLKYTDEKMQLVEKYLASRPEVERYYVNVGTSLYGGDVNSAFCFVTMKPKGKRGKDPELGHELSQHEFMQVTRKKLKEIQGFRAVVQDFAMRGLTTSRGFPVEFTIQGPDWDTLGKLVTQAMDELSKTKLIADIDTDYKVGMPELKIIPDRVKVSQYTLNLATAGETINAMIGGTKVGQYSKGGHRYDVRVKLESDEKDLVKRISRLDLRNQARNLTPLSNVVNIVEEPTVQSISRLNRQRAVTVYANVVPGASQKQALEKAEEITNKLLPVGYTMRISGGAQTFGESFGGLLFALMLGLFVAYMILGAQFNSFIHPLTILTALPFSVVGAFIGLWITNQSLNIYSMIGLILLMGIAKKNSILLVDFTTQVRSHEGLDVKSALSRACPIRLRPILMTSIATIAGALPAAFAIGPGSESRIPMAITVIGGVLFSTLITLYLVPCAYLMLSPYEKPQIIEDGK